MPNSTTIGNKIKIIKEGITELILCLLIKKGEIKMYKEIKKIEIEKTKKGYPAIWESGGGCTNTGKATIVSSPNGQPKKPIYVRNCEKLSNSNHALFILEKGDLIVEASHHRRDFDIRVWRVSSITKESIRTEFFSPTHKEIAREDILSEAKKHQWIVEGEGKILEDTFVFYPRGKVGNHAYGEVCIEKSVFYATLQLEHKFDIGEWDIEPPIEMENAIHTAMEKATCYHCREPFFVQW